MHITHSRGRAFALLVFSMSMGILPSVQAGIPGSTSAINVDEHGVALHGYDPVAYFTSGKPTPGIETISASYGGARYLFATKADKKRFVKNPEVHPAVRWLLQRRHRLWPKGGNGPNDGRSSEREAVSQR